MFANPGTQRRIALGVIALGALLTGAAAWWREGSGGGGTYLLSAAGLWIAVSGAVLDARAARLFFAFDPQGTKRRALLLLALGLVAALLGCLLASADRFDSRIASALGNAALTAGAGLGLGGLLTLLLYAGGDYAARRIEQRIDEDL